MSNFNDSVFHAALKYLEDNTLGTSDSLNDAGHRALSNYVGGVHDLNSLIVMGCIQYLTANSQTPSSGLNSLVEQTARYYLTSEGQTVPTGFMEAVEAAAAYYAVNGGGPGLVMDAAPATLEGSVGNTATYPHYALGRGPHTDKYAIGTVLMDGSQVVRIYEKATGTLLETEVIRDIDAYDDHNDVGLCWWSDGSLEAYASGHNSSATLVRAIRDPAGTWTSGNITMPDVTTYPSPFVDDTDDFGMFIIRCENVFWYMRYRTGINGSPTNKLVFSATQQIYCSPRQDVERRKIYFSVRYNNSLPVNGGQIRIVEFDIATREFFDANGPLGKLDGTASSNGKTLPINIDDIAIFESPDSGRLLYLQDQTYDTMIMYESDNADYFDNNIYCYRYNGSGDRLSLSNWTKGVPFTAQQWKAGNIYYLLGADIANEPHTGVRVYMTRGYGAYMSWEQWDNVTGDNTSRANWKMRRVFRNQTPGQTMFRCMTMNEADEVSPIVISTYDTFDQYDTYTNAQVIFKQPNRNAVYPTVPSTSPSAETLAWVARMSSAPSDMWLKYIYDPFVVKLVNDGIWAKLDGLYFLCAHDKQASLLNMKQASFDATQAGGIADAAFIAGRGWKGDGVGYLDTNFNPNNAVGKLLTTTNNHLSLVIGGEFTGGPDINNTDVTDFGNDTHRILSYSMARTCNIRCSQTTTSSVASWSRRKAAGIIIAGRNASNNVELSLDGIEQAVSTAASATASSTNLHILGRNGTASKSPRVAMFAGMGQFLTAAERLNLYTAYVDVQNAILEAIGPQN